MSGLKRYGNHDWYQEGADEILKHQLTDGRWEKPARKRKNPKPPKGPKPRTRRSVNLVQTCFALLFLKRSTIGVIDEEIIITGTHFGKKKEKPDKDK